MQVFNGIYPIVEITCNKIVSALYSLKGIQIFHYVPLDFFMVSGAIPIKRAMGILALCDF